MFDWFEMFFINLVEINLCLMEVVIDFVVCGYMYLEGWFLRSL